MTSAVLMMTQVVFIALIGGAFSRLALFCSTPFPDCSCRTDMPPTITDSRITKKAAALGRCSDIERSSTAAEAGSALESRGWLAWSLAGEGLGSRIETHEACRGLFPIPSAGSALAADVEGLLVSGDEAGQGCADDKVHPGASDGCS